MLGYEGTGTTAIPDLASDILMNYCGSWDMGGGGVVGTFPTNYVIPTYFRWGSGGWGI